MHSDRVVVILGNFSVDLVMAHHLRKFQSPAYLVDLLSLKIVDVVDPKLVDDVGCNHLQTKRSKKPQSLKFRLAIVSARHSFRKKYQYQISVNYFAGCSNYIPEIDMHHLDLS